MMESLYMTLFMESSNASATYRRLRDIPSWIVQKLDVK